MLSAVPSSARVRRRGGSNTVARKTIQVRTDEHTAADRMPSFASSSCAPLKASAAMRRATVKPIPAMVPPPATAAQPTGGRNRPRLNRVTSHEKPRMPIGFPAR